MTENKKKYSVSQAAALCGVGRTTVGYWIRTRKLHANRTGRNYSILLDDLLFFLKSSGQKIPPELLPGSSNGPIFKSLQTCWHYWHGSDHGRRCCDCIAFKNQLQSCFTIKDSGLLNCTDCNTCRYYTDIYLNRIQFIHQIDAPAAVFQDLYLWGGNSLCADLCGLQQQDLVGIGLEKIVFSGSLPKVIEAVRKMAVGKPALKEDCSISINNGSLGSLKILASIYPLRQPPMTYLVVGVPLKSEDG
jgi:excisionase family DNA binding protein